MHTVYVLTYVQCTNVHLYVLSWVVSCTVQQYVLRTHSRQLSCTVHIHVYLMLIASFLHTDYDECKIGGRFRCQYKCINTQGSYECECPKGMFSPSIWKYTCFGECAESSIVLYIAIFFYCLTSTTYLCMYDNESHRS